MKNFLAILLCLLLSATPVYALSGPSVGAGETSAAALALDLNCTDCVDDTEIDWGTGAGQVSASDVPDEDVGDITITSGDWAVEDDSHAHGSTTITLASTDLSDTADLLYETELDDFSELQAQISDKTLVNEEDAVTWDAATQSWVSSTGVTLTYEAQSGDVLASYEDSDIAHGLTSVVATDVFGRMSISSGTVGGWVIEGFSEGAGAVRDGLSLRGYLGATDPDDTLPALSLFGAKRSGTAAAAMGADEIVWQAENNGTAIFTGYGDGDHVATGSLQAADYYSGDGTQGATTSCGSGTTLTVKDGLITACA